MLGLSHKIQTNLGPGTLTKPGIPKILWNFSFLSDPKSRELSAACPTPQESLPACLWNQPEKQKIILQGPIFQAIFVDVGGVHTKNPRSSTQRRELPGHPRAYDTELRVMPSVNHPTSICCENHGVLNVGESLQWWNCKKKSVVKNTCRAMIFSFSLI